VPRSLGAVRSFEELAARMRQAGCPRVFVKLAHGSSASGVAAYQTDGRRHQATTTVEMVHVGGELRLYNSRRIRVYRELPEIAALIDALCRHRVHVEQWLPKAGLDGRTVDLRVVVIGGQARHTVVRLSRSPMTNLHLLNDRGDPATLRARMGPAAWDAACQTCERAMAPFAGSLYAGIDLLVAPDYRRHAVLEVNAFGDLLPGVLWEGRDTYTAELRSALQECPSAGWGGSPPTPGVAPPVGGYAPDSGGVTPGYRSGALSGRAAPEGQRRLAGDETPGSPAGRGGAISGGGAPAHSPAGRGGEAPGATR
jgi:hypothetical protein